MTEIIALWVCLWIPGADVLCDGPCADGSFTDDGNTVCYGKCPPNPYLSLTQVDDTCVKIWEKPDPADVTRTGGVPGCFPETGDVCVLDGCNTCRRAGIGGWSCTTVVCGPIIKP